MKLTSLADDLVAQNMGDTLGCRLTVELDSGHR